MSTSYRRFVTVAAVACLAPGARGLAQSSVAISPFVSYVPSAATNPLAGMALTFGGTTGLALRGSADISTKNPRLDSASAGMYRPWGADADLMLFLGGLGGGTTVLNRSLSPYVFSGLALMGNDSAGRNVVRNGWSYGAGVSIPLGFDADVFGEARWRMNEYVLPTAKAAPDGSREMRFGLSFHVGGGGSREPAPIPRRRGYGRYDAEDDGDVIVAAPAPSRTVIVPVETEPDVVTYPEVSTVPSASTSTSTSTVTGVDVPEPVIGRRGVLRPPMTRRVETVTVARGAAVLRRRGIYTNQRAATVQKQRSTIIRKAGTIVRKQGTVTSKTQEKREVLRKKRPVSH